MVTRGWNGYRNKTQHRKSTLEKKILPPFQQGFEPATFQSRVRRSNHWAIPAPIIYQMAEAHNKLTRTWLLSSTITLAFCTTQHSYNWPKCSCFSSQPLPWYNPTSWLGVKHQLTYHNLATHIHHFILDIFAFHIQATKPALEQKKLNWFNTTLVKSA